MFGRKLPAAHCLLLGRMRLPRPNWYVGGAGHAPMDPALRAEVERVKAELRSPLGAIDREEKPDER